MEAIDQHIQTINTWATEKGLDYYILDPVSSGESSVAALRERTSTCGDLLWDRGDAVHLAHSGYRDQAGVIMSLKGLIDGKEEGDKEGLVLSGSSSTVKRARLDLVVTKPDGPAYKAGYGTTRPYKLADWLLGENAPPVRGQREYYGPF
jgi:hypothetical protein